MNNKIKIYQFKENLNVEFELLDVKNLSEKHLNIITKTHRASFYHIIWFEKETTIHTIDFNSIEIPKNSILILNKNVVHKFKEKLSNHCKIILFTDSFFCNSTSDLLFLDSIILANDFHAIYTINNDVYHKKIKFLFDIINIEFINFQENSKDILRNYLHSFLLILKQNKTISNKNIELKKDKDLETLSQFKYLLNQHFLKEKKVQFYINKLFITEKKLNQITIKFTGNSPKNIITKRVILESKRLLVYTNLTIKEISFELGFLEPTNFVKFFKKETKITPLDFKIQNKD